MDLKQIYTQLILEESRNKKNRREIEDPTYCELGHNPSCGDEITLQVKMNDEDIIEDISFTGSGCAISQASTSIMTQLVQGKTRQEAIDLADKFISMVTGDIEDRKELKELKDARAFENIQTMPARVKCAELAWYTLKDLLEGREESASFSL